MLQNIHLYTNRQVTKVRLRISSGPPLVGFNLHFSHTLHLIEPVRAVSNALPDRTTSLPSLWCEFVMSSTEESPAQRAARLRRERREAKIKEGGAARLDKITSLSGRTPSKGEIRVDYHADADEPLFPSSPSRINGIKDQKANSSLYRP
jgi:hypothetical protein